MNIDRKETEENVYITFDGCQFCRETTTEVIDNQATVKTRWFFKKKPDEVKSGARFSHWSPCSEMEAADMEKRYIEL